MVPISSEGPVTCGGGPGELGAHRQHCLPTEGFHRPGRSTVSSSEGRWGDPRWGGTRRWRCVDSPSLRDTWRELFPGPGNSSAILLFWGLSFKRGPR